MGKEETVSETDTDSQNQEPKTSRLAIASMVCGILGPFFFGAMWIVSFLSFRDLITAGPFIMTFFSCAVAWILGLILGIKSLGQITNSKGQLVGRGYAIVGITISAVWMILILAALFLPAIYYVNS